MGMLGDGKKWMVVVVVWIVCRKKKMWKGSTIYIHIPPGIGEQNTHIHIYICLAVYNKMEQWLTSVKWQHDDFENNLFLWKILIRINFV